MAAEDALPSEPQQVPTALRGSSIGIRMNLRWVLPLIFVAGYLGTFTRFESFALEYAVLTEVACLACCLLLTRLNRALQATLPFWVMLALFVLAYYVKFYWIASVPEMELLSRFYLRSDYLLSTDALFSAFATTTYAFGAFCCAAWLLLGLSYRGTAEQLEAGEIADAPSPACNYRFVSTVSLWTAVVLIPVTTLIMQVYGVAVMGVESVQLPFHLAGLVYFTRSVFVPAVLVLLIWSSQQAGLRKRAIIGVILVLMFGVSDMLLRSSRGGLAAALFLLAFLLMVGKHRIRRRDVVLLVTGSLVAALVFPIVAEYRNLRLGDVTGDLVSLFAEAERSRIGGGLVAIWDTLALGVSSMLLRLTGVDMLAIYHGLAVQPLGDAAWSVLASPRGIPGYVTVDIMGFSPDAIHSEAPGLVGWFYLIGGNFLSVVGLAAFTSAAGIVWSVLKRLHLKSLPVAQVLFLTLLLSIAMDGTLDTVFTWTLVAWPASIAACEWLCRVKKGVRGVG